MPPINPSEKSRSVALALAVVLGVFGGHRFYVGKTGTGVLMLCTLGGMGLWWVYDCILVGMGQFTDNEGRRLSRWDPDIPEPWETFAPGGAEAQLLAEVEALRLEVAELAERMDFAERLLGRGASPAPEPRGRERGD